MSDLAIRVENLGKRYTIGVERHDMLADFRLGILDFGKRKRKSTVENPKSGEVVGVIKRNGAGKSTLSKPVTLISSALFADNAQGHTRNSNSLSSRWYLHG